MATVEQLNAAIRAAHAKGRQDLVRKLALMKLQVQDEEREAQIQQPIELPEMETVEPAEPPSKLDMAEDVVGAVSNLITGDDRTTPQIEALPDWSQLPEYDEPSLQQKRAQLYALISSPEEAAKILKANFPGVKYRKDEKGNLIITSSVDGKDYAVKPGFRTSDLPRALSLAAMFSPAGAAKTVGGAALGSAATQAAIEAGQAASGGDFDINDVGVAGVLGGAFPLAGRAIKTVGAPAKRLAMSVLGMAPEAAEAAAPAAAKAATGAVGGAAKEGAEDVVAMIKKAVGTFGGKKAQRELASFADIDEDLVRLAREENILGLSSPDYFTRNEALVSFNQGVKSPKGSVSGGQEEKGLAEIRESFRKKFMNESGADSLDKSAMDVAIRKKLQKGEQFFADNAEKAYTAISQKFSQADRHPARRVVADVEKELADLGGDMAGLSEVEREVITRLKPKVVKADGQDVVVEPTYHAIDKVRRDIGRKIDAAKNKVVGATINEDLGTLNRLYGSISDDLEEAAARYGLAEDFAAAKALARKKFDFQRRQKELFGYGGSSLPKWRAALTKVQKGDTSDLIPLLKATPKEQRPTVLATVIEDHLAEGGERSIARTSSFARSLNQNAKAKAAVLSVLPENARRTLINQGKLAEAITDATRKRTYTGLSTTPREAIDGSNQLQTKLLSLAAVASPSLAVRAAASVGTIWKMLKGSKFEAYDKLLASPEWLNLVITAPGRARETAARRMAQSSPFRRFVQEMGSPRELSNPERWILESMQAANADVTQPTAALVAQDDEPNSQVYAGR